jgi:hypothetical protein
MSDIVLPPSFVPNGFEHSRNRRFLKYAVQVRQGNQIVKCISVSVDVSGGMPPPAIKRRLTERVIQFIANAYPGQKGLTGVIAGRIDLEI